MRVSVLALCGALVSTGLVVHGAGQPPDAAAILADVRAALGGEARLSAVKMLVATGRTRQVRGDNLVPIEFEIAIELPDRYVRKDEVPAQESGPTTSGFNGDALIQAPAASAPPARPGAPAPPAGAADAARLARVTTLKQDFARLTLGLFAGSFSSYPLTFTYAGQAEAPQGKAWVLNVAGPSGFAGRLFVDTASRLPLMFSWQRPAGRGGPPGGGGPPSAPATGTSPPAGTPAAGSAAPPKPPEYRLYYADYRETDGLMLPFRLRRATGSETTEETTFDRYRVNVRIDARKFEVRK